MKIAKPTGAFRRPTPLRRNVQNSTPNPESSLSDSLAICLFGFTKTMYDSEYEEEMRKRAIMAVSRVDCSAILIARKSCPMKSCGRIGPKTKRPFVKVGDGTLHL
jgi:hypothetical protein